MITKKQDLYGRRNFMKTTASAATGLLGFGALYGSDAKAFAAEDSPYFVGPLEGYSPQIGTLVSMLNYNRFTIKSVVKCLTVEQLDYLHDAQANTIGALLLHLAAVDKFYQLNTFEGKQDFNDEEKKMWGAAMDLGDEGRKNIKGHDVKYYLDILDEVRQKTLAELKKKDDKWLVAVDAEWSKQNGTLNTYWKWFHVCEHESNHRGQISWLKSRLPGAKPGKD